MNNFKALVDWLKQAITDHEQFHLGYADESSEFVRFNHGKVRQAGQVQQASLNLKLINDGRHADLGITLAGEPELDRQRLADGLQQLRETLPLLPQDPYLLLNHNAWQNKDQQDRPLPDLAQVLEAISAAAEGVDMVGFYAAGPISRGFASSSGAFGWHQANSFNFDFSLFHANGEAVKASYAGNDWDSAAFAQRFQQAREQLEFLGRPLHPLAPVQFAEAFHGDGDQHHRRAEQQETHAVETGAFAAAQVGDEFPDGVAADDAHRQVDQEDPVPGQVLHHPATHGRAEQWAQQPWNGDETHDPHQLRTRVGAQHHQPAHRQHQRTAQALDHPGAHQHGQRAGECAEQRANAEQHDRAEENLLGTEAVGHPAGGRDQQRNGQHVGDHHALHAQGVLRQVSGHGRQSGVENRPIQRLHEEGNRYHPG